MRRSLRQRLTSRTGCRETDLKLEREKNLNSKPVAEQNRMGLHRLGSRERKRAGKPQKDTIPTKTMQSVNLRALRSQRGFKWRGFSQVNTTMIL